MFRTQGVVVGGCATRKLQQDSGTLNSLLSIANNLLQFVSTMLICLIVLAILQDSTKCFAFAPVVHIDSPDLTNKCSGSNSQVCSTPLINSPKTTTTAAKGEQKTADLSKLINETLAINNKSIPSGGKASLKVDDWTFDRVEYDLIEFLQDLSARYKLNNLTGADTTVNSTPEEEYMKESTLEGKVVVGLKEEPLNQTKESDSHSSQAPEITVNKSTLKVITTTTTTTSISATTEQSAASLTPSSVPLSVTSSTTQTPSSAPQMQLFKQQHRPTSSPELSTSLASGEPEIAESSWQYGIFDRFTRPKSTSTTTREPQLEPNAKLDVRNFNSDECGLRTYDVNTEVLLSAQADMEASKELNQRRQKPFLNPLLASSHKKYQFETVAESLASLGGADQMAPDQGGANEAYDSYDKQDSNYEEQPPSSDQNADNEFNLASRRQWLQQQLGNTLQLLGFNASSQSPAEFLNQTSGVSLNNRENMMKKSGKFGKSASKLFNALLPKAENTAPSQDDLKLEARVIGGNDARL